MHGCRRAGRDPKDDEAQDEQQMTLTHLESPIANCLCAAQGLRRAASIPGPVEEAGIASANWGLSSCEHRRESPAAGASCRRGRHGATVRRVSMKRRREDESAGDETVELVALADGSIAPERRRT